MRDRWGAVAGWWKIQFHAGQILVWWCTMSMVWSGETGCECINQTDTLSSIKDNLQCTIPNGENGVLTKGGFCVPYYYGTNCLLHDMLHDPNCQRGLNSSLPLESTMIAGHCNKTWCYIERDKCKRESSEDVYASDYFPSGDNLFYSYTTCNSTAEEWLKQKDNIALDSSELGEASLYAAVPGFYQKPALYKRNDDGEIITKRGDEYYDDSVPFEGIYMDYIKDVIRISNGDIKNVSYTHTSKASTKRHPLSQFTAAVQDIENGIVDMAVGPFWITGQRLKMMSFTVPLLYDQTVLVIPTPRKNKTLRYEASKVLKPFTGGLWSVAISIIGVSALLSVWLSDADALAMDKYGTSLRRLKKRKRLNKTTYGRLALDAFLGKGLHFFGKGVDCDPGESLPYKFLMFGFGFFIFIATSCYVANLAAFLTQPGTESFVGTIDEVIAQSLSICAHPALKEELIFKWPTANFVWSENEFYGILEKYDKDECEVLAMGRQDTMYDMEFMQHFCDRGLIFTDSLIIDIPIAFPVKHDLATGLSYWIYIGDKYKEVSMQNTVVEYMAKAEDLPCLVELRELDSQESDDYAQISPQNMILPIIVFMALAAVAIILQIVHDRGTKSFIGRATKLDLFLSDPSLDLCSGEPAKSTKKNTKDAAKMIDVVKRTLFGSIASGEEEICEENQKCTLNVKRSVRFNDAPQDIFNDNYSDKSIDEETQKDNSNAKRSVALYDYPGVDSHDSFDDNAPLAHLKGSSDVCISNGGHPMTSNDGTDFHRRIQNISDSSAIDDVFECLQEMKRLKKLQ